MAQGNINPHTGRQIAERAEQFALQAMQRVADDLMGRAQREAPIDEGTLRGSAHAELRRMGDRFEVEVSFNTPYAARQHEEVTWEHPKGGKAKYLSDPLKEMVHDYTQFLTLAMRRALEHI